MRVHELVSDELWAAIAPLLPPHPAQLGGGRPWLPDRPALCGIIFVLRTGVQWRWLPQELGCGSGVTCWQRLHRVLLARLEDAGKLDWSRACADSAGIAAKKGATWSARTRRIAANRAPSGTSWLIAGASGSRRG